MEKDFCWLILILLFTGLMWLPYVFERIFRMGLMQAMGNSSEMNQNIAAWALRCQKSHSNAIEGLVVFAPLVLIAHTMQIDILIGIQIYCISRVLHYICYTLAVPLMRTATFFVSVGAQLYIGLALFGVL